MAAQFREYYSKEVFCALQNDPAFWSEDLARKTLRRFRGTTFNIEDTQLLIKYYLGALCETTQA